MRGKRHSGVTLVELMIAVAVLLIAVVPIFAMYSMSIKTNAMSHKITLATFAAQQKIEEYVGLTQAEVDDTTIIDATRLDGLAGAMSEADAIFMENDANSNGFDLYVWQESDENGSAPGDSNALIKIYVKVVDFDDTSVLCTQSDIINVAPGGIM